MTYGRRMDTDEYLRHLRADSEALLAAASVDLSRPVPGCPDWDVADLVWHIGRIHERWGRIARAGATDPEEVAALPKPERPDDADLLGWAREQAEALLDTLAGLDPATPCWNWTGADQTAAFLPRRMAHETAVHRVDAEQAAGEATPIDARLAADGIDEALTVLLPTKGDYDGPTGFVGIAETVSGRAWAVALEPPRAAVVAPTRVPRRASDIEQLTGNASTVQLTLWGRAEPKGAGELTRALVRHLAGA